MAPGSRSPNSSLTIAEGSSGTYTIVLDSQPTADVTVTINDPSNTDVTAEPASLTFSSTDWNTPKTVTVNAAQDADAEDETATVTHAVTSTDSSYSGASANSVAVSVTDDEVPVTVSFGQANYTVAEGDPVSVTVTLSADPERTVVIPLTHTPQGSTTSADYSGVPANVTFSTGDMSQTITFTATQDDVDDGGKSVLLAFGTTLPGGVSLGTTTTTTVNITDDDGAGVSVSNNSLDITEGSSGTYTIVLDSQPTADVTVTINDPSNTDVTAEPASLTFSSTDWNTPKTVTVNAAQDADADDETATVTHTVTSTDSSYSGASANSVSRHHHRRRGAGDGVVRSGELHGRRGRPGLGDGHFERGPGAHGGHSPHAYPAGQHDFHGLLRGARECDLQHGGHVADDHLHGNPGRRGRRRQERAARLRDDAAGRGEPGHDDHAPPSASPTTTTRRWRCRSIGPATACWRATPSRWA